MVTIHYILSFLLVLVMCSMGCKNRASISSNEKYVKQVFDSIGLYSQHRYTFNLDSLENELLNRISDSTSHHELIQQLEYALKTIDRHNYIISREKYHQMNTGTNPDVLINLYPFQFKMLQQKYAFISLDGFKGVDSVSAKNYTDSLQRGIKRLYNLQPKGWIIDLRNNTGGWIYPMLAGLGPILGPGIKSYEISRDSVLATFYFCKDSSDYILLSDSVWFFKKQLPVAVLIGEGTASAGELLTLSFRGNPKTTLIGSPTYGVSTGLHGFFMPDSNWVCVTNCIMTDREKRGDGGSIIPDFEIKNPILMFEKAYAWIESQN